MYIHYILYTIYTIYSNTVEVELERALSSDVWIPEKKMFPPLTENIPEKDCRTFSISQPRI